MSGLVIVSILDPRGSKIHTVGNIEWCSAIDPKRGSLYVYTGYDLGHNYQ